jgi:hypothetical protein
MISWSSRMLGSIGCSGSKHELAFKSVRARQACDSVLQHKFELVMFPPKCAIRTLHAFGLNWCYLLHPLNQLFLICIYAHIPIFVCKKNLFLTFFSFDFGSYVQAVTEIGTTDTDIFFIKTVDNTLAISRGLNNIGGPEDTQVATDR